MSDKIFEFDDIAGQSNVQPYSVNISSEIIQLLITPDNKEYIVLHNYYNNYLDNDTNLNLDNVKIYRDTFVRNDLENAQIELKIFPYLYGPDSKKIIQRLQSCYDNTNINSDIHLFYIPLNSKLVVDPRIDSITINNANEIVIKFTMTKPGYLFIGKVE